MSNITHQISIFLSVELISRGIESIERLCNCPFSSFLMISCFPLTMTKFSLSFAYGQEDEVGLGFFSGKTVGVAVH